MLVIFSKKLFKTEVEIPRIKKGKQQTLYTLINEEALLLARFMKKEKKEWVPRLINLN